MKQRWDGVWRILNPLQKRLGPDGKIHEGWCAIFERECCSCRDDGKGRRRIIRDDDGGAKVETPPKESDDSRVTAHRR
jgi:hypothetical protein